MPPKEIGKHQLSNRLQFQSHTPNFLRAFKSKASGFRGGNDEDDEDAPTYENGDEYGVGQDDDDAGGLDEFGRSKRQEPAVDEFGREIRREENTKDTEKGKKKRRLDEEEDEDEKPVVVVLKEGKHLTEREAENERRRARGLSPLPDDEEVPILDTETKESIAKSDSKSKSKPSTAPKSGVQIGGKIGGASKRKAPIGGRDDEEEDSRIKGSGGGPPKKKVKGKKGTQKSLLSFGEDG